MTEPQGEDRDPNEHLADDHDPSVLSTQHAIFTITKPVNFVQLTDEVKERLGDVDGLNIQGEFQHPNNVVDAGHPMRFLVGPVDSIDQNAVNETIEAHEPDPFYGDVEDDEQRAALHKVVAGEQLSETDLILALQGVIAMVYYRRLPFTRPDTS